MQVGQPDDLLDLLDRVRQHHRRGGVLVPGLVGERIAELAEVGFVGEDVLGADGGGEAVERGGEVAFGDPG